MRRFVLNCVTKWALAVAMLLLPMVASAADYRVGIGQTYTTLGAVPWSNLKAGDTVYIHYRSTPYREKILISGKGTASQWIRVIGVPGPNGELPVISGDGATTSPNSRYRWPDASGGNAIQNLGVIQIAVQAGGDVPAYIEVANLQVQDALSTHRFTSENGVTANYSSFAACIHARSVQHLLIRNNVLTNCGQGFYNWTGTGPSTVWYEALQVDTVLRSNYFYGNGNSGAWTEHQSYTESDGVIYEFNRFGPMRSGAWGSQLKDRSVGTVIRYNYFQRSDQGWMIDLVEPENSRQTLGSRATYGQDFVYGNVMSTNGVSNLVHWNEDHQLGVGRATRNGARLAFYNNTVYVIGNDTGNNPQYLFNSTYGAYECTSGSLPGVIDLRNNIFASAPSTSGGRPVLFRLAYCSNTTFNSGTNWITSGWTANTSSTIPGAAGMISTGSPAFVNAAAGDFHIGSSSAAVGRGTALLSQVVSNVLNLNLTPTLQYKYHLQSEVRASNGAGSDLGAFGSGSGGGGGITPLSAPQNLRIVP